MPGKFEGEKKNQDYGNCKQWKKKKMTIFKNSFKKLKAKKMWLPLCKQFDGSLKF